MSVPISSPIAINAIPSTATAVTDNRNTLCGINLMLKQTFKTLTNYISHTKLKIVSQLSKIKNLCLLMTMQNSHPRHRDLRIGCLPLNRIRIKLGITIQIGCLYHLTRSTTVAISIPPIQFLHCSSAMLRELCIVQAWVNYIFNQLQLNYNYMTFDQLQLQSGKLQLQLLFTLYK